MNLHQLRQDCNFEYAMMLSLSIRRNLKIQRQEQLIKIPESRDQITTISSTFVILLHVVVVDPVGVYHHIARRLFLVQPFEGQLRFPPTIGTIHDWRDASYSSPSHG